MQIKTFEGDSMEEILARVRKTLGEDAVVLSTKKAKRGMGAFTRSVYEVSAGIDRTPVEPAFKPGTVRRFVPPVYRQNGTSPLPSPPGTEEIFFKSSMPAAAYPIPKPAPAPGPGVDIIAAPRGDASQSNASHFDAFLSLERELAPLKEEIHGLKAFLELVIAGAKAEGTPERKEQIGRLADEVRALSARLAAPAPTPPAPAPVAPATLADAQGRASAAGGRMPGAADDYPEEEWLVRRLLAQGLSARVCLQAADAVASSKADSRAVAEKGLRSIIGNVIESSVRANGFPAPGLDAPRIIAFVGPEGSGKTSAVSRAAAHLAGNGFRVAIVAVGGRFEETRRAFDAAQSKHGVPVLPAADAVGLERAVATCFGAHYLLIDVAGSAASDRTAVARLSEMVRKVASISFCLTVPADQPEKETNGWFDRLSTLPVDYVAFTKADRARRFGPMANATAKAPALFISTGKSGEPGSVFPARPYMFSRLLLERGVA